MFMYYIVSALSTAAAALAVLALSILQLPEDANRIMRFRGFRAAILKKIIFNSAAEPRLLCTRAVQFSNQASSSTTPAAAALSIPPTRPHPHISNTAYRYVAFPL